MQCLCCSGIVGSLVQHLLPCSRRHCHGTYLSLPRIGGQSVATSIANEKYKGLGIPLEIVNLSITTYMIAQGIAPSFWAPLADRQGRRMTLIYTLILYAGSNIALGLATNTGMLLIFRALQAAGSSSTIALGAGIIADISPPHERGGYLGWFAGGNLPLVQIDGRLLTTAASTAAQPSTGTCDWWSSCWLCRLEIDFLVPHQLLWLVCDWSSSGSPRDTSSDCRKWRAST